MYSYHLRSHPRKFLVEHLHDVSELAVQIIKDLQEYCPFLTDSKLIEAMKIIGLSHDIGKGTVFFQEYLPPQNVKHDQFLKSHSLLSSLYGYVACKAVTEDDLLSFIALMLIQGHHGGISNRISAISKVHSNREKLTQQIDNIKYRDELSSLLLSERLPELFESGNLVKSIEYELNRIQISLDSILQNTPPLKAYFIANMMFSALIDADRMNAAGIRKQARNQIDHSSILGYVLKVERANRERFGDRSEIMRLRVLVRQTVLSNLNVRNKIFSFTAPTGSGKTLTALLFASMLREEIFTKAKRMSRPRIIYVAPFLGIIDQNSRVIANALGIEDDSQSSTMITHHHLSKLLYENIENESYSNSVSELLIEGWNAEVIITTFVQFLETIIGARASSLRKLHNIAGSIIILDEVQSIDYKYWLLVQTCLKFLSEECDSRIILMTATQPLIFKKTEVFELFTSDYKSPDRVKLKVDLESILLDEFSNKLKDIIDANPTKSILVIMNTISSSVYVFRRISTSNDEEFYLSSLVTPYERQQRIIDISERLARQKRTILVSTQVVEAGVDLDFDIVVRDLAPVDSIIQAAGRCNRNGQRPAIQSYVFVFAVCDHEKNYFANKIYGNVLINLTREILSKKELKISMLADYYYQKVLELASEKTSTDFLDAINILDYETVEKFEVIEDEPTISIFVEVNREAQSIWQEFEDVIKKGSAEEQRANIRNFFRTKRSIFYRYVVNSRRLDLMTRAFHEVYGFYRVSQSSLPDYYDYTGLKVSENVI